MANYLKQLDDEISALRTRIAELEITRRVLTTMVDIRELPNRVVKKKKPTQSRGTVYRATRDAIVQVLTSAKAPIRATDIFNGVRSKMQVNESTMWKALKDLRNEGAITWDRDTRMYSIPKQKFEVAS